MYKRSITGDLHVLIAYSMWIEKWQRCREDVNTVFAKHKQTCQKKHSHFLKFRGKIMVSDHSPYNLTHGNGNPAKEFSVYFNGKRIVRGYHAYKRVWVTVGKELPCRKAEKSELAPVAVTAGE